MNIARNAAWLVIGGWLLVGAMIVVAGFGNSVQIGGGSPGSYALIMALAMIGCGLAVLSVTGPRPLQGRLMRVGLGVLAVGLVGTLISTIIAAGLAYDPLENGPFVATFLLGSLAICVGLPLTVLSLLRHAGPTRRVGSLFLAGLLFVFAGNVVLSNSELSAGLLHAIGSTFVFLGAAGIVLAGAGTGALPLRATAIDLASPG
jgi:hypothetical protein